MNPFILSLGGNEIIFIILALILLFGVKRIPELARMLGKGVAEFKNATDEIKREINDAADSINSNKNIEKPISKKDKAEDKSNDNTSKRD